MQPYEEHFQSINIDLIINRYNTRKINPLLTLMNYKLNTRSMITTLHCKASSQVFVVYFSNKTSSSRFPSHKLISL
ncbi:hypothetical protein Lwal_0567 [Legionella waltersii]|uniref:Uncharacterized protein n=1 Tax=Legionella waltersii TaxID=66969 RepID=A0A0W1AMY8_9GAMM|nr:hypothetical protein Lwal_0567 [Legionella waltersii]SNV08014.1 Uncharacterised protein [Legionella waltersii]